MILGTVAPDREAAISLTLSGPHGQFDIRAIIDTGFNGWLSLPSDVIARLGLRWDGISRAELADGSVSYFDIFEAIVHWDGIALSVSIDAAETDPLVGMSLLWGFELRLRAEDGGLVTITRI